MHGQFIWYELITPDVDAAQKFYPRFTNWGTQKFDNDYTMWTSSGKPFAGIFRLNAEMRAIGVPPNWMPYVETDDVDRTASLATSLGGKVVNGPADIPGTGRYAVVQDPQGATFGIYKSNGQTGAQGWDGTPVVGHFSWHELMTSDMRSAEQFYQKLFGWERQQEMDMPDGSPYSMFGKGKMFGGMFNRPAEMATMHPFWLVYIHVKDVAQAVDTATKAGAFVKRPRNAIPGGTMAILGDPQGAGFALHDLGKMPKTEAAKPAATASKPAAKKSVATKKTAKAPARAKKKAVAKKVVRSKPKPKPAKKAAKKSVKKVARKPAKKAPKRKALKKRR